MNADSPSTRAVGLVTDMIVDVVDHAIGRRMRPDPVGGRSGGPAGNALLTAWIGLSLLVLSVAELLTLFDVRGLIDWHVVIGALLIPPALVKTATTTWRMVRYYLGNEGYQEAGPPPMLLRLLGPLVVLSTVALLATGVILIVLGEPTSRTPLVSMWGARIGWVTLHQASFIVWCVAAGLHVLARMLPALRLIGPRPEQQRKVPGSAARIVVVVLTVAVAALTATLLVHADASWQHPTGYFRD